jgi:hypothetical protein
LAKDVLAALRARYPKVTFVLVPGLEFPDAQKLGLTFVQQVRPALDSASQMNTDLAMSEVLKALGIEREPLAGADV